MVLTIVLLVEVAELSTFAEPVEIGTSLPTIRVATWLSMTTTDGFDNTLRLVTACRASRTTFGLLSPPTRKLKPGHARLSAAATRPDVDVEIPPVAVVVLAPGGDDGWPGG